MTWLTWSLLSALFAAATAILAKVGIAGIDANLATAVRTFVVVIFTWLLAYATRKPEGLQALSNKAWLFLVLSGLATGLSWLCYFHALQVGPASRVAPIDKLSVALVILFGAVLRRAVDVGEVCWRNPDRGWCDHHRNRIDLAEGIKERFW